MSGWIKVYRTLLNNPIWIESTPEQKTILITLLLMVNHQKKEWEWQGMPYTVIAGQVITSLESIAQKCGKGISIQNVRTALKRFERFGFLTGKSTNKNRLITINNWEFYQTNEGVLTSNLTESQQAINKQLTTNNNDLEIKNGKEVKRPPQKLKIYDEESIPFQLSVRLLNNIRGNNPQFKEPNIQKWSDDFRLMMERDNRTKEQIVYLVDWCQQDSFWKSIILSPAKLRGKFDQLVLKIPTSRQVKKQHKSSQQISIDRPSHWDKPKPLTKQEKSNLKKLEDEMPF